MPEPVNPWRIAHLHMDILMTYLAHTLEGEPPLLEAALAEHSETLHDLIARMEMISDGAFRTTLQHSGRCRDQSEDGLG